MWNSKGISCYLCRGSRRGRVPPDLLWWSQHVQTGWRWDPRTHGQNTTPPSDREEHRINSHTTLKVLIVIKAQLPVKNITGSAHLLPVRHTYNCAWQSALCWRYMNSSSSDCIIMQYSSLCCSKIRRWTTLLQMMHSNRECMSWWVWIDAKRALWSDYTQAQSTPPDCLSTLMFSSIAHITLSVPLAILCWSPDENQDKAISPRQYRGRKGVLVVWARYQ